MSAAQNAANTISNTLNTQNRSRSGTEDSAPANLLLNETGVESESRDTYGVEPASPRKQLAVETLGAGDLKLSHLGIGTEPKENGVEMADPRKDSTIRRDEAAAKIEDMLAKERFQRRMKNPQRTRPKLLSLNCRTLSTV